MKRLGLTLLAAFLSLSLIAQEEILQKRLEETRVEPPNFSGYLVEKPQITIKKSPICCFLQDNMEYPQKAIDYRQEGIVVIEFTVEPDATLSNFKVVNHVSHDLDNAVISCLKLTNGMWIPGKVNGIASPMEKEVSVMFDLEDTPTLVEQAKRYYLRAVKVFNKGFDYENETIANVRAKERKEKRFFNRSLRNLEYAQQYAPNEPSFLFWQARNYEELNNNEMLNKTLNRFIETTNSKLTSNYFKEDYDVAVVVLK